MRSVAKLRGALAGISAAGVLCGHTHRETMTRLDVTLMINVGAVSNQVDGDPRARWLLEERAGQWCGIFQRVAYDWKAAGDWMMCHAPDPEEEIQNLLTGWCYAGREQKGAERRNPGRQALSGRSWESG